MVFYEQCDIGVSVAVIELFTSLHIGLQFDLDMVPIWLHKTQKIATIKSKNGNGEHFVVVNCGGC